MTEREQAIALANKILDRPSADPDDDLAILSRQFLRALELPQLKDHWLFGIECHHEAKTDQAICACGLKFPERENVGLAIADWSAHLRGLMAK